jgi:catechol 2,3-dioxygenase-like lactoylglutathione lyase family enzyme
MEIADLAGGRPAGRSARPWPDGLHGLGGLRFGWGSVRFEETEAFYRDLVGLPLLETFQNSYGSTGAIFGLPGAGLTFELVQVGRPVETHVHERLCLYFPDKIARDAAIERFRVSGTEPAAEQHPYWSATGAVTFLDPDGREVVFAPFIYGPADPP